MQSRKPLCPLTYEQFVEAMKRRFKPAIGPNGEEGFEGIRLLTPKEIQARKKARGK